MDPKPLSPREEQVVELAVQGNTNDGIAKALGISVNTVNSYWVRIRLKVEGGGRTAVVAKLIQEKAEKALRESNVQKTALANEIATREHQLLDLRAALSLLQLAMDQLRSGVWATDSQLRLLMLANGEIPHFHDRLNWQVGNTIYQVVGSEDADHPIISAHLAALKGKEVTTTFGLNGDKLSMYVKPLLDDEEEIVGCMGVLISLAGDLTKPETENG